MILLTGCSGYIGQCLESYFNKKELRDMFLKKGFTVKKNYNRNSFLYSYYDCFTKK